MKIRIIVFAGIIFFAGFVAGAAYADGQNRLKKSYDSVAENIPRIAGRTLTALPKNRAHGNQETVPEGEMENPPAKEPLPETLWTEPVSENPKLESLKTEEPKPEGLETEEPKPEIPIEQEAVPVTSEKAFDENEAMADEQSLHLAEIYGNNDIIGYLCIENTSIDYPVLQSGDNVYYLSRDANGNSSAAGSIYMDYENDIGKKDKNIVLYGHNMKADIMFHSLRYYRDWAYYNTHKYIRFDTLYDQCLWEVFAFYATSVDFNYIQVHFSGDEAFLRLASEMKAKSMYDTGIEITAQDRILTLSTCTNISDDTRYVLNARLISVNGVPVEELWE